MFWLRNKKKNHCAFLSGSLVITWILLNNRRIHLKMLLYLIVGEPKSRIVQKHTFVAPERYTAGILYTDSLKSA